MYYWEIPETAGLSQPDAVAIQSRGVTLTWRELLDRVDAVAGLVSEVHATERGRRVGVLAHNGRFQAELYYGISKGGAVIVPLNWRLSDSELGKVIENADVDFVFTGSDLRERLPEGVDSVILDDDYEAALQAAPRVSEPLAGIAEDDVTMIGYTSGTSGEPKGVMHTHRSLFESALHLCSEMRIQADDVFFGCLPLFFAGGSSALSAPLLRGCRLLIEDFSPETFLNAVETENVSATIMVPTMIVQVLNHPDAARIAGLGRLKQWSYAGASIARTHVATAIDMFGPIFSGLYGQLESGLMGTTLGPEQHADALPDGRRLGSIGRPTIGCGVRLESVEHPGRLVEPGDEAPGEIWIRSPATMKGYWRRPELTEQTIRGGWLKTGDIAVQDADGYLYLVDRATEKIVTGGINVFPREIEELLVTHPAVAQAAVVGMPAELWGEEITACLTLAEDSDADVVVAELTDLCGRELSSYKKPRAYVVLETLPMTGSGKIAKSKLRTELQAQREAAAS